MVNSIIRDGANISKVVDENFEDRAIRGHSPAAVGQRKKKVQMIRSRYVASCHFPLASPPLGNAIQCNAWQPLGKKPVPLGNAIRIALQMYTEEKSQMWDKEGRMMQIISLPSANS